MRHTSLGFSDVYWRKQRPMAIKAGMVCTQLNDYVGGSPTQPCDGAPWQWWDVATTELVDAANGTFTHKPS